MRISWSKLKKLIVETRSGVELGSIRDIILDVENQNIFQYEIGSLVGKKYLISREQIISIDEDEMVVDDGVIKEGGGNDINNKIGIAPEEVMSDSL